MSKLSDQVIDAIREVAGKNYLPLHEPKFAGNETKYVLETIKSTFVSSVGAFVDRFEDDMSSIAQTKLSNCICWRCCWNRF